MMGYSLSASILFAALGSFSLKAAKATAARLVITLIIAFMVISSPIVIFINPGVVWAASSAPSGTFANMDRNNKVDTSSHHTTLPVPDRSSAHLSAFSSSPSSPSSTSSTPTIQAALTSPFTAASTNIVNVKATYDIGFRTTTAGTIKTVEMQFPAGTFLEVLSKVHVEGIGPGAFSFAGANTLIYTANSAVNIPANTLIRFVIGNIQNPNPLDINAPLSVTITTKNTAGTIIDGPTPTNSYVLRKIDTAELANNAVTTEKIADDAVTDAKLSLDSVYTVWRDDTPGNSEILYKRSTVSFDPDVDLSNNAGSSSIPATAASGNNVYVVWDDNTPGNDEILYRRSTDGGATFGSTINLSNNAGSSSNPATAAVNNLT